MSDFTLHSLSSSPGSRKRGQRVGRGGKRGTTAGRGTKGQRARTGGRNKLSYLGMRHVLLQTPQLRGHAFKARKKYVIVNIDALERGFQSGETVTGKELAAKGILKNKGGRFKVLARGGTLTKALMVRAHAFSENAKQMIEKAGGRIEIIQKSNIKNQNDKQ